MEINIEQELQKFGRRLRELRKKKNLTQIDLELLCGVGHADISRMENGQKNSELITIIKIAMALEVNIFDMFDYKSHK